MKKTSHFFKNWLVLVLGYEEGLQLPGAAQLENTQAIKTQVEKPVEGDGEKGPADTPGNHRNPSNNAKSKKD